MKHAFTFLLSFSVLFAFGQTTVFTDDFESGTSKWTLSHSWGLTATSSHSSSNSLSESPNGLYADSETSYATMSTGVDLSGSLNADLSFWAHYEIEGGFDYMYLEVSPNGGSTWTQLDSYDDTLANWTLFSYSLGGYVGNSNVKIRFRFVSDGAVHYDGMYIDDVLITSDTTDRAAPLVLHTAPSFYQASLYAYSPQVDIIDISGVADAKCFYSVDGMPYDSVVAQVQTGNTYSFQFPVQEPGALIRYYFKAVDSAAISNTAFTDTFSVIQGNYISYDNGQVDFVDSTGAGGAAAVKITLPGPCQLTNLLIRNYTDINRPNDSMLVHVWSDSNGTPGTDLITPIMVAPWATLQNTSPMTLVDLRADSAALSGISGDVFIGFSVPSGAVWANITQPGMGGRSYKFDGTSWILATGTGGNSDFHFRAITSGLIGLPQTQFTIDSSASPTYTFTDGSVDATSWYWNFGDGTTLANTQNPTHTFLHNGQYRVCLVTGNNVGTDTLCKNVHVSSYQPPVSAFRFADSLSPEIYFFDLSTNNPISWIWKFDHNGMSSGQQNPVYTYPAISATYHVCLTAISLNGTGDSTCQNIVILDDTGIGEGERNAGVKVFPNPFTDETRLQFDLNNGGVVHLNVYDQSGKLVKVDYTLEHGELRIKRGNLEAGHYVFEVIFDGRQHTGHLLVR